MTRLAGNYLITAVTIFLSAFLLFAIQPIASKHLLPYFGGSSSVWAASLVFFTAILFFGYTYVYVLTARRAFIQMIVHGIVIVAATAATMLAIVTWGSIYPPLDWITESTFAPSLRVLIALALSVGIPYFLLSTTGPLLQYWYGVTSDRTPYKLYALSNAGSLLALVSYPFLIEPHIPLTTEETMWTVLFFVYALLLVLITVTIRNIPPHVHATAREAGTLTRKLEWVAYGGFPAYLLVATTTVLTQLISPVPLLWVVPLALYLLTYIIAFTGMVRARFLPFFVFLAAGAAYLYTPATPHEIVPETIAYLSLLFFTSLFCHTRLFELRPHTPALPFFYLCTSLGGVLGTIGASFIAPMMFNDFFEFPLGLAIAASIAVFFMPNDVYPRMIRERTIRMIRIVTPFVFAVMLTNIVVASVSPEKMASRNFYGSVQVNFSEDATVLMHGTTIHGMQPTEREWSYVPTMYYTQNSGVGRAIRYTKDENKLGARVGIIGLGTGSLATYCEKNDVFVFYEIDPRIEDIARTYFSYLARCEGSDVRLGDGRIVLQSESATTTMYDMIAVDAFTDDSIPAHLLTQEAVELYIGSLSSERGIVAIHTSNRFLTLYPVLLSIARELGLTAMVVNDDGEVGHLSSRSQWVLLSKDARVFDADSFIGVGRWTAPIPLPKPWTDTYTSLFTVIDVPLPF